MKDKPSIEFENDAFKCWVDDSIAIIKIKCNAFYSLISIDVSKQVLDWFEHVSEYDDINVILLLNEKGCLGNTAYEVFVTELTGKEFKKDFTNYLSDHDLIKIRTKEINILNSFIRSAVDYKKLVVTGLNGTIFTPFFGASLASNFRFASDDMIISFSHAKYGLHAGGAVPFFLPKFIGYGKSAEYIFSGGEINAKEALSSGLINRIFPSAEFWDRCIGEAKNLSKLGSRYLSWSKHLSTPFKEDLIKYLRDEEQYVDRYRELE